MVLVPVGATTMNGYDVPPPPCTTTNNNIKINGNNRLAFSHLAAAITLSIYTALPLLLYSIILLATSILIHRCCSTQLTKRNTFH